MILEVRLVGVALLEVGVALLELGVALLELGVALLEVGIVLLELEVVPIEVGVVFNGPNTPRILSKWWVRFEARARDEVM